MTAHLPLLLAIAAVHLVAMASPGPNWLVVTRAAMHRSRAQALATAMGVASAGLVWSTGVVLGLAGLLALLPWLELAIRVAGGAYLLHLGVRAWRGDGVALPDDPEAAAAEPWSLPRAWRRGLLTNLTNPKSAAYFAGVLAPLVGPGTPPWVLAAAVAIVTGGSTLWHAGLAIGFSTPAVRRLYRRLRRPVDRVTGAVMIAFGAALLLRLG